MKAKTGIGSVYKKFEKGSLEHIEKPSDLYSFGGNDQLGWLI